MGERHFGKALNRKWQFLWSNFTKHTTRHRDAHLLILMSCMAADWMVLTLRPNYWSWWKRPGRPGRSFVKTNVCLSEWCLRRDAERRELTGLLAPLLIPEAGKGTGPNKASGPDCLASHRFINVKSSTVKIRQHWTHTNHNLLLWQKQFCCGVFCVSQFFMMTKNMSVS